MKFNQLKDELPGVQNPQIATHLMILHRDGSQIGLHYYADTPKPQQHPLPPCISQSNQTQVDFSYYLFCHEIKRRN